MTTVFTCRKIEDQLAVYSKTAQQHTTEPQSSASAVRSAGTKGSDGITENTTAKDKKNSKNIFQLVVFLLGVDIFFYIRQDKFY